MPDVPGGDGGLLAFLGDVDPTLADRLLRGDPELAGEGSLAARAVALTRLHRALVGAFCTLPAAIGWLDTVEPRLRGTPRSQLGDATGVDRVLALVLAGRPSEPR